MQRSRILPTTGRGRRPRGQHAGGQVHHGRTQRCHGHRLTTDQPRGIAQEICHARIAPIRSTCWAAAPDSPPRASRTPARPPPTRAAKARARIGLISTVVIVHIELPSCARVGSRHLDAAGPGVAPRCLTGYADSPRRTSPEISRENRLSVFLCRRWSRQMGAVSIRHGAEQQGHGVPERSTPEHGTRRLAGPVPSPRPLVAFVDVKRRTRRRHRPPHRQGMQERDILYDIAYPLWGGGQPQDSRT